MKFSSTNLPSLDVVVGDAAAQTRAGTAQLFPIQDWPFSLPPNGPPLGHPLHGRDVHTIGENRDTTGTESLCRLIAPPGRASGPGARKPSLAR